MLHGYEQFPAAVRSDVDCLIERTDWPRLRELLVAAEIELGFRLVQWFDDAAAQFIVLAGTDDVTGEPYLLQLHVSGDYEIDGRQIFAADEILRTRRRYGSFYVPFAQIKAARIKLAVYTSNLRDIASGAINNALMELKSTGELTNAEKNALPSAIQARLTRNQELSELARKYNFGR